MPRNNFKKEFKLLGSKLKEARLKSNLDQHDIAKALNKTQSDISKLESGHLQINIFELLKLSKLYKKNLSFFLPR